MRRREIERELEIDEAEILAATTPERGAEPIKHLGGARLRRVDQRRQLLAGLKLGRRLQHQRMTRQRLVERGEYLQRLGGISLPRQETAIALHHAQRGRVELVGTLEALGGVLLLTGEIKDHRGVQILEDGIPVRTGELVDGVGRGLDLGRARHRPCRQQGRGKIGDRAADRLGEFPARDRILLLLDRTYAEHEPGDAVGLVDLQNALGQLDRFIDLAVRQHRQEGAAEQLVVARVSPERGAIVRRRGGGIPLTARVPGGQDSCRKERFGRNSRVPPPVPRALPAKWWRVRPLRPRPHALNVAKGSRLVDSIWRTSAPARPR